jgi:hypothetical protein
MTTVVLPRYELSGMMGTPQFSHGPITESGALLGPNRGIIPQPVTKIATISNVAKLISFILIALVFIPLVHTHGYFSRS